MNKLVVVWKSKEDTDIDYFMFPYAFNSKKSNWFDDVEILIWGASQEIARDDERRQRSIKRMIEEGIKVYACKMCSDHIGATDILESLGVEVIYTGVYLSVNQKDPNVEVIVI